MEPSPKSPWSDVASDFKTQQEISWRYRLLRATELDPLRCLAAADALEEFDLPAFLGLVDRGCDARLAYDIVR